MDLKECREQIDRIDEQLSRLLQERLDVSGEVIRYKEKHGLPILDKAREEEKIRTLRLLWEEEKAPYLERLFQDIMRESRAWQEDHRVVYGLLGDKLGHSHSPAVHRMLGDYEYGLFERDPGQLETFFEEYPFRGISVTMPYKKTVMDYCGEISPQASACGSVNTIVRREDGSLYGANTDYDGFRFTVESSGIDIRGAKAMVLGSGGVSGTVVQVLRDLGADPVVVVSRSGPVTYEDLDEHDDAEIIVNATPVGMFPRAGEAPVDLQRFSRLKAVYDLIYNPLRTKLMLDAERLGIPAFGGLPMLVAQAAEACRLFAELGGGEDIHLPADPGEMKKRTETVIRDLERERTDILLIGMPGAGKTTVGDALGRILERPFADLDEEVARVEGRTPEELIRREGEDAFRNMETETLRRLVRGEGAAAGRIIACGGGIVEREENRDLLRENGQVVWIRRPLEELPVEGRPLSQQGRLEELYERRREKYAGWSDLAVDNDDPEETANRIAEWFRGERREP